MTEREDKPQDSGQEDPPAADQPADEKAHVPEPVTETTGDACPDTPAATAKDDPESRPQPPLPPPGPDASESSEDDGPAESVGSPAEKIIRVCRNCGRRESEPDCVFCARCGEHLMRNRPLPITTFFKQILEEMFDFDNKVWRTLGLLLFKPGQLTLEYSAGRRSRYTRPTKMYVFLSAIYFLLFSLVNPFGDNLNQEFVTGLRSGYQSGQSGKSLADLGGEIGQSAGRQLAAASRVGDKQEGAVPPEETVEVPEDPQLAEPETGDSPTTLGLSLSEKVQRDLDETTSPVKRAFLERLLVATERIQATESGGGDGSAQEVIGQRMQQSMQKWLPIYSLLSMILIALVLKLLYIDTDYYLGEHLVFATHYTLFTFAIGILMMPIVLLGFQVVNLIAPFITLAYFSIAQYRFYREPPGVAILRITVMVLFQCFLYCSLGLTMGIIAGVEALFF